MMPTYELNTFDPAFAHDLDCTGDGVMFSYNEPALTEQVWACNCEEEPEDLIICLTGSGITLYPFFHGDEEPEPCFFCVGRKAGLDLITWIGAEQFNLYGDVLEQWAQNIVARFAFEPTKHGGIALDDMNGMERSALYDAYKVSKAGACL